MLSNYYSQNVYLFSKTGELEMTALFSFLVLIASSDRFISWGRWLIIRGLYSVMIFCQFLIHILPSVAFTIANTILLGDFSLQYFV